MKKLVLLLSAVFFFASTSLAQWELVEKVDSDLKNAVIGYEKWKLTANDLTLIIHEDHSDPIAHVQVAYHVGSARESVRNSGFAHFFEHMMFQGSKHVADEEHFEIISESGGTNNAFTSFDKTVYHQTAPSNMTEMLLWLEADRMGTHLDGFTQKKFENQRDAVKNEKRQRYDNQPYGMVNEELFKAMFSGHPYEWTPIGFVDDLDAASFDDLRNFFLRWYGPNNASVVVSGDVEPEQVKTWVAKYFGGIQKCKPVAKMPPQSPRLPLDVYVEVPDNIYLPMTMMSYPTVHEFHPDRPALDVLAEILGGTRSSYLYQKFVKAEDAVQAGAFNSSLELTGLMGVQVVATYNGLNKLEVEKKIRECFAEFEANGVREDELNRAITYYKSNLVDQMASINGKSLLLSHWDMMNQQGYNLNDEIKKYESLTAADVMRVYNKYIKNRKAVVVNVFRDGRQLSEEESEKSKSVNPYAGQEKKTDPEYQNLTYTPPKDDFDRSVRPIVPKAGAVEIPEYWTSTMGNGLKIIGSQSAETPKVRMYMTIKGGHLFDGEKKMNAGTANLTAALMNEGTAKLSSEEFSKQLDLLGSSISWSAGNTATTVYIECFKDQLDATLALFKESLMTPRMSEEDFSRLKKQQIQGLNNVKSNPSALAQRAFYKVMFEGTVFETPSNGNIRSLSKVDADGCKEYRNRYYAPNLAQLVVLGDLTQEEAMAKLGFLNEWKKSEVTLPEIPKPAEIDETTIFFIDKEYAPQSVVSLAHTALPYDYNGDYYKSTVMNYPLGGAFNSRINLNLREDKGYTYGARSYFNGNAYYGYYQFFSNVKKEATDSTVMELMKEIKGYKDGGITDKELSFTKSSILLSEALDYETPFQKLGFLNNILTYNLPKDYTSKQAEIVKNISKSEVDALAKKYLKPENAVIIIVGHGYKVKPGLEKLGYGKLKEIAPSELN